MAILSSLAGLALAGTCAAPASAVTTTFGFTGGAQGFTVPPDVTSARITAIGAPGGSGPFQLGGPGGAGGMAQADFAVTPGQALLVNVGGPGASGSFPAGGAGGFNGGRSRRP